MRCGKHAVAWLISLLALPLVAQTAGTQPASVQGSVTDSVLGVPVPRAHVTLQGSDDGKTVRYGATSGADGSFSFTGVAPGKYLATAERVGFVRNDGIFRNRGMLTLQAGDNKTGIEIRLTPTGSITGRITNSDGGPVENIHVSAENGRGEGQGEGATTDEKGQFRIGGLTPGKYDVRAGSAEGVTGGRPEVRTDGTTEVHEAATYYPGVVMRKEAVKVDVRAGMETTGIDIHLVKVPFVRVSGRVIGLPKDTEADLMISQGNGGNGAPVKRDGSFELWRLDPGKYILSAEWEAPNGEQVSTVAVEIEVAGSNVDNIELRVVPASDISGRLEFEDDDAKKLPPSDGPQPNRQTARITLVAHLSFMFESDEISAAVDDNGAFHLTKVPAGRYSVQISWGTSYVKSMRLGTSSIEGAMLDLTQGSGGSDLSVMMGDANGSVSGTVQDAGSAAPDTIVVLADDNDDADIDFGTARTTSVKSDGTYSFDHLAPGHYLMIAVPESDMAIQGNRVVGYEDRMETVSVEPGDKITKDLKRQAPAQ